MSKELSEMTIEELWTLFPIILKPHNKAYKQWYAEEELNIRKSVPDSLIERINHIGSSAVENLIAKPTVDILLELKQNTQMSHCMNYLTQDGWTLMHSQEKPYVTYIFNKGYTKEGFAEKVYHLHVRYAGDWNELYFRDYLKEHPAIAELYGQLKQDLIHDFRNNRDGYTEAKTEFIELYTEKARKLYAGRYNI